MAITTDLSVRARERVYSDVDFAFRMNPVTNDVSVKRDVEAVKQSVLNILSTNRGERPFMPDFGGNIRAYLFENVDPVTISLIEEEIRTTLSNYEPRVRVLAVDVNDLSDQNAINIRLEIEILSPTSSVETVEFVVERLR
jgi:phage baseplate assembly protein W